MGLILDTSAAIGWIELQDAHLIEWLRENAGDDTPKVHIVTLGELERGILEASDEGVRSRRADTLRFCRDELSQVSFSDTVGLAHLFGVVSSAVSRKISHNDCWITAAALGADDTLVTMDRQLADQLRAASRGDGHLSRWLRVRGQQLNVVYLHR